MGPLLFSQDPEVQTNAGSKEELRKMSYRIKKSVKQ